MKWFEQKSKEISLEAHINVFTIKSLRKDSRKCSGIIKNFSAHARDPKFSRLEVLEIEELFFSGDSIHCFWRAGEGGRYFLVEGSNYGKRGNFILKNT